MVEFGLISEDDEIYSINFIKYLARVGWKNKYDILFDHTYEMADNPSKCRVLELENKREAEFRKACDHYLINPENFEVFLNRTSKGRPIQVLDDSLWDKIEKCKAV